MDTLKMCIRLSGWLQTLFEKFSCNFSCVFWINCIYCHQLITFTIMDKCFRATRPFLFWNRFKGKIQCIFNLLVLFPLGEEHSPSLEQFWILSPKDDLCQLSLVKIGPVVLEKSKIKFYRQMDNGRSGELIIILPSAKLVVQTKLPACFEHFRHIYIVNHNEKCMWGIYHCVILREALLAK
jgi:hypothetical protein